ncbi:MAG: hypothetical protein ACTHJW_14555 [Streptosporangiaceae bacterium]
MMPADEVVKASMTSGCLRGCLVAAGSHVDGRHGGRGLGVAALVSWLLAESLGAYMFRSWLAGGGGAPRQPAGDTPDRMSPALILGHASLALAGLISWVTFLASGLTALAWLAVGLLAPAIGLGISTVTVWTPYPVRRPPADQPPPRDHGEGGASSPAILVTNEMLDRVLADETLTSELVDELVERMLAEPPPQVETVSRRWQLAPVIPILHGILALATFLLAVLAAIAASA